VAFTTENTHPADEFVQSAHKHVDQADEYLITTHPTGALLKADNPRSFSKA
jgi:hypothetical protein